VVTIAQSSTCPHRLHSAQAPVTDISPPKVWKEEKFTQMVPTQQKSQEEQWELMNFPQYVS